MTGFEDYKPNLFPRLNRIARFLFNLDSDTPNTGGEVFLEEQLKEPTQETLFNANISGWGYDDGTEQ